jgi:hypothetical protein
MLTLTQSERRALQLVLLIAVSGLVGKVWLRTHPQSQETPIAPQGVVGIR